MNTSNFFNTIYNNAKQNAIIIIRNDGFIENINKAFTISFGYNQEDVKGKPFEMLFSEKDRLENKAVIELATCREFGSAKDENYLLTKDRTLLWVNGESICIKDEKGDFYFVKIIQNIHGKKELERFLMEAYDFIDNIFDSVKETAFIIVDSRLKVVKSNKYFNELFNLPDTPKAGSRLTEINNDFWKTDEIKYSIINCLVTNTTMRNRQFEIISNTGNKTVIVSARILEKKTDEKHILIVIALSV